MTLSNLVYPLEYFDIPDSVVYAMHRGL